MNIGDKRFLKSGVFFLFESKVDITKDKYMICLILQHNNRFTVICKISQIFKYYKIYKQKR